MARSRSRGYTNYMHVRLTFLIIFISIFNPIFCKESDVEKKSYFKSERFKIVERAQTQKEIVEQVGFVYSISLLLYGATQWDVIKRDGSSKKYWDHFGEIVFDNDQPVWNWYVHPFSGSLIFQYYRFKGHNKRDATLYTFISSALFEFTGEIYTEPSSMQDLYQTPIFGAVVGLAFENISIYLHNLDNPVASFFGYVFNPFFLFEKNEQELMVHSSTNFKNNVGVNVSWNF